MIFVAGNMSYLHAAMTFTHILLSLQSHHVCSEPNPAVLTQAKLPLTSLTSAGVLPK